MRSRQAFLVRRVALVIVLALTMGGVGAYAAESPTSTPGASAKAQQGSVDVQYWMEDSGARGSAVAIVSTTLDASVELPAVVQIPLPDGMTVEWAGEVSASGDIDEDIQREFAIKSGREGTFAEFELRTYRVGQIDLGVVPVTVSGDTVSATFRYVQSAPASQTAFSVKVPPYATDVVIAPAPVGSPRTNSAGESLHTLPSTTLATGQAQDVTVTYVVGDPDAAVAPRTSALSRLVWVLFGLALLVAIVLVWALARARSTVMPPNGPEESNENTPGADSSPQSPSGGDDDPFEFDQ